MKAFIDPTTQVQFVESWTTEKPYKAILGTYENSGRICQVEPDDKIFPISEPYFWVSCADGVTPETFWYDTVNQTINPIINAPYPAPSGVQSV